MDKVKAKELYQSAQTIAEAYLTSYADVRSQKTVTIADDETIQKLRSIGFPKEGRPLPTVIDEMIATVYPNQAIMQHPRFFAFVPSPASPVSWIGDILTNSYNPHAGTWLESSSASCLEQETIKWLCQQAGYSDTSGGLFVSGGSIANLTALVVARHAKLTEDEYPDGVVYLSQQTHFSASKALRIMGVHSKQIRIIPCDDNFRMDTQCLENAIIQDYKDGKKPFLVVATAGTTNAGCIDPLPKIADLSRRYQLWLHVDGAYGASILVSKEYRHLLDGISCADSITWDAHKWLFQTYGCSMVLFKDKTNLVKCFHSNPEYLKDAVVENDEINYWEWGIELTRPARSLKLWLTLQTLGTDKLSDMVTHGLKMAEYAEGIIREMPEWEIITPAQLAVLNFRYTPKDVPAEYWDSINAKISQKMMESGFACVLTTNLKGNTVLRICSIHPETTQEDMRTTIERLNIYANEAREEFEFCKNEFLSGK